MPLKEKVQALLSIPQLSSSPKKWEPSDLSAMEGRIQFMLSSTPSTSELQVPDGSKTVAMRVDQGQEALPEGWGRVNHEQWKSCPLGVFVRG